MDGFYYLGQYKNAKGQRVAPLAFGGNREITSRLPSLRMK
jgi:hypothetical protein